MILIDLWAKYAVVLIMELNCHLLYFYFLPYRHRWVWESRELSVWSLCELVRKLQVWMSSKLWTQSSWQWVYR